jgi:hypothetical protein
MVHGKPGARAMIGKWVGEMGSIQTQLSRALNAAPRRHRREIDRLALSVFDRRVAGQGVSDFAQEFLNSGVGQ